MRMGAAIFWGVVLMLIGLSIIVNVVFHVNIPIFKFLLAFLFIYVGVRILIGDGACGCRSRSQLVREGEVIFHERTFTGLPGEGNHYNVLFGKAVIDLRNVELKEKVTSIRVDAVFGTVEILLDRKTPVRVKADAVFGSAQLPDHAAGGFGSVEYASEPIDPNANRLEIQAAAVFGAVKAGYSN